MAEQHRYVAGKGKMPQDVHYTLFVRLPFARGDFVNPPLVILCDHSRKRDDNAYGDKVDWDAVKDQALWNILSQNPRSTTINCKYAPYAVSELD